MHICGNVAYHSQSNAKLNQHTDMARKSNETRRKLNDKLMEIKFNFNNNFRSGHPFLSSAYWHRESNI